MPRANKKYVAELRSPVKLPPTAVESRFERAKPTKKDDKAEKSCKLFVWPQKSKSEKKKKEESPTKKMAKGKLIGVLELLTTSSKNIYFLIIPDAKKSPDIRYTPLLTVVMTLS